MVRHLEGQRLLRKTDILLHKDIQHCLYYCLEIQMGNCREEVQDGEEDTMCWHRPRCGCKNFHLPFLTIKISMNQTFHAHTLFDILILILTNNYAP